MLRHCLAILLGLVLPSQVGVTCMPCSLLTQVWEAPTTACLTRQISRALTTKRATCLVSKTDGAVQTPQFLVTLCMAAELQCSGVPFSTWLT
jgi:hypothetical protein